MGLYRDENGILVEVDDNFARTHGYTPVSTGEEVAAAQQAARAEDRGLVGDIAAATTGLASSLTLGGTDVLLGATLTDLQRERLAADIEASPIARGAGEIAGSLAASLAAPGSTLARTPAGAIAQGASRQVEAGLARGGVAGTARAMGAMGAEGAAQSVGQYVGMAAIQDVDVTAEGAAGALGTGFAFGAGAGGAALGIQKGTISARKLWSRTMDGGEQAVEDAARAWEMQSQQVLEADTANLEVAQRRLDEIRAAKVEAQIQRDRAAAFAMREQAFAEQAAPRPRFTPEPPVPMEGPRGGGTQVIEGGTLPPLALPAQTDEFIEPTALPGRGRIEYRGAEPVQVRSGDTQVIPGGADFEAVLENVRGSDSTMVIPGMAQRPRGPIELGPVPDEIVPLDGPIGSGRTVYRGDAPTTAPTAAAVPAPETVAASAPATAPTAAAAPAARRVEVVRYGSPSKRQFEIRTWEPGAAEPQVRVVKQDELVAQAKDLVPDGFTLGNLNTRGPFTVEPSLPATAADVKANTLYVARPSEIAERGIFGNTLSDDHLSSIRQAWGEGKKLPPIEINITPQGRLFVEDGNHRLQAAIADDRPLAIVVRKVGDDFKPQAGAVDISDRLRAARRAPAGADDVVPLTDSDIPYEARNARFGYAPWEDLPWERAYRETATLLGDDIARQEAQLMEALEEFERASAKLKAPDILAGPITDNPYTRLTSEAVYGPAAARRAQISAAADDWRRMLDAEGVAPAAEAAAPITAEKTGAQSPSARRAAEAAAPITAEKTGAQSPSARRALEIADRADELAARVPEIDALEEEFEAALAAGKADDAAALSAKIAELEVDDLLEDLKGKVDAIADYERASAKLSAALGEDAAPVSRQLAEQLSKAEDEAMRKFTDRQARALEDAETFGPWEQQGPAYLSPKERVKWAKARQSEANAELAEMKARETEALRDRDVAKRTLEERKRSLADTAPPGAAPPAQPPRSRLAVAADAAAAVELVGLPGMPRPSDLPVVGPLLGAYLKFRAVKAIMNRMSGRVPATADVRMAALAARTKERIAKAVDRSLNLAEKTAKAGMKSGQLAGVLAARIYDDGEPDAPKGASVSEVAAVRMRELAAYVSTPGAIERDVRRELAGVTDPDLIAAAENHRRLMMTYLLSTAPKVPEQNPLEKTPWRPSYAEAASFARRLEAANDPAGVWERVAHQQAMITLEAAETLRAVYPSLFAMAQRRLLEQATRIERTVPYTNRVKLSLLYDVPLDSTADPATIRAAFTHTPAEPAASPGAAPPTPAIANPTNLTAMYQTTADRRAMR